MSYPSPRDPDQIQFQEPDPWSQIEGESAVVGPAPTDPTRVTMVEAEHRIAKANCYKALIHDPFFDNPTRASQEVEAEVRAFVQGRFEELLGMARPKPVEQLTDEEVKVLKTFVQRIQAQASQPRPPAAPTPPAAETSPQPTKPSVRRRAAPVGPRKASPVSQPSETQVTPAKTPPARVRQRRAPEDSAPVAPGDQPQPAVVAAAQPPKSPAQRPDPNREDVLETDSNGLRTIKKGNKLYKEIVTPNGSIAMIDVTTQAKPAGLVRQAPSIEGKMAQEVAMATHAHGAKGRMHHTEE